MVPWHQKLMTRKHLQDVIVRRIVQKYRILDVESIVSAFSEAYCSVVKCFDPKKAQYPIGTFQNWLFKKTRDCLCGDRVLWRRKHCYIQRQHAQLNLTTPVKLSFDFENQEFVSLLLTKLTEKERQIVKLHLWGGWQLLEISQLLNMSYTNVKYLWHHALEKLKHYCKRKGILK